MAEIARYHLDEEGGLYCFGSNLRYNRVLYGGHNHDDSARRFFTFAGDAPIFMGALSDYKINNWCYQAKCGVLQSGLALTPGVKFGGNYSRWFHNCGDLLSTWHHGYMEYEATQFGNYFPECKVNIQVFPLQEHDGFCVSYDILADAQVIFCAVLSGMTGFIGRFDNLEAARRDLSKDDCVDCEASLLKGGIAKLYNPKMKNTVLVANNFGATMELDGAEAALETMPAMTLTLHEGAPAAIKMSRRLMAGERLSGEIIVMVNEKPETLKKYLANPVLRDICLRILKKGQGIVSVSPDRRLDGTVQDMQIALDASYHTPTFNHGAVGYHAPFLGWRGWYGASDAGWFDRVKGAIRAHLKTMQRSNVPEKVWYDGADRPDLDHEGTQYHHIANSNGRLTPLLDSDDIYDMQEVAIDMTFHYLERTGDLELGREIFDDLAELLAWEERILDPDGDGLYQSFLNTWISDGHVYNGGGCAQASCYNYAANVEMVRLGKAIGRDTAIFKARADKIYKAMQNTLWLKKEGVFAEYIDTIGNKMLHPSPELSTIYLASEAGIAEPKQMASMLDFTEKHIRSAITRNREGRLAYSANWLPKKYSTCGIFPAENAALALAYFRNRNAAGALQLLDGLLDAFALSAGPGAISHVLAASGANDHGDWDFTDVTSTYLRLIVEGLWGVRYSRLSNEITIEPQLPDAWDKAALRLSDLSVSFVAKGKEKCLKILTDLDCDIKVYLPGDAKKVLCNGKAIKGRADKSRQTPAYIITLPRKAGCCLLQYTSEQGVGNAPELLTELPERPQHPTPVGKLEYVDCSKVFNTEITKIYARDFMSPRPKGYSIGARKCGRYAWEWNHYGHNELVINDDALRKAAKGIYRLPSGWSFKTPAKGKNVACASIWDNFPTEITVPLSGSAKNLVCFVIGGTNAMQNSVVNGEIVVKYKDGSSETLQLVHPYNFDDFLLPNVQQECECFYFADGCHGTVLHIPLKAKKKLASFTVRGVANEVIVGLLGAVLER